MQHHVPPLSDINVNWWMRGGAVVGGFIEGGSDQEKKALKKLANVIPLRPPLHAGHRYVICCSTCGDLWHSVTCLRRLPWHL